MVQVVNNGQKAKLTPNPSGKTPAQKNEKPPLFRMPNYILMGVGAILLIIGFFCISGGGTDDPTKFNLEVFNTRRTVVADILILLGLVTEIFAIMWHPRVKQNQEEKITE